MITKIILQQQYWQEDFICREVSSSLTIFHKIFLIELKEHFEELIKDLRPADSGIPVLKYDLWKDKFKENIIELNKLIENYK